MTIGFGIVGTGMIAEFHARAIADIPGAQLVGCFDQVAARAEKYAAEKQCLPYSDLSLMLANPDIHIITICTPSGAHRDPAVAAANAGKHVLVEKPLEITLAKCDAIIQACAKNKVLLGAILPSRFSPANIALKQAITSGRFGRITQGDTYVKWWRSQEYYDSGAWRGTWELDGGGAYMNQAIHNVDLLYWFMGDVQEVCGFTATLGHERIDVEDVGSAIVRFKNGAIGTLEASTTAFPGLLKRTEIHGTKGSVIVEQDDILLWEFAETLPEDETIRHQFARKSGNTGGASDPKAISYTGHLRQFENFTAAVRKGTSVEIDGYEGRKSVEIILSIYASSQTGKKMTLPLPG